MGKRGSILTGRIFLSSKDRKTMWFTLDEKENAFFYFPDMETRSFSQHIVRYAEKWLSQNNKPQSWENEK